MEDEFGRCSRPSLKKTAKEYCDGSYRLQGGLRHRCALTEVGIRYWDHLPRLFDWPSDRDHEPCPFGATYQLARNVLAATVMPEGELAPTGGHALVVYDARNPAFQANGMAEEQWRLAVDACLDRRLLRRLSWQSLLTSLVRAPELAYLVEGLAEKYGLKPDEQPTAMFPA